MGRKPRPWHDPSGRFSLDLPVGWTAHADEDSGRVALVRTHEETGAVAEMQVELRILPPGVRAAHLDAHVQRENRDRAPGYQLRDRRKLVVSGAEAVQTLFTYRARGNAQLGREVLETVFVVGERGFVLTFETLLGARSLFSDELELILTGFSARGSGEAPRGSSRQRRKIRAGEMVNPDAVGY